MGSSVLPCGMSTGVVASKNGNHYKGSGIAHACVGAAGNVTLRACHLQHNVSSYKCSIKSIARTYACKYDWVPFGLASDAAAVGAGLRMSTSDIDISHRFSNINRLSHLLRGIWQSVPNLVI
jgi:hypothetical protein